MFTFLFIYVLKNHYHFKFYFNTILSIYLYSFTGSMYLLMYIFKIAKVKFVEILNITFIQAYYT